MITIALPPSSATSRRASATARAAAIVALVLLPACGGDGEAFVPTREYTLHLRAEDSADEYEFVAEDPIDLRVGDRVTFEVRNDGTLAHDLQVLTTGATVLGTAQSVGAGGTTSVTVDFEEAGYYQLTCNVDDHLTRHDMKAVVQVVEVTD